MNIGVFDSGIGGKSIAESLARDIPGAKILYVHDAAHMPYGGRSQEEIIQLTDAALQPLLSGNCACIVIACNTATAAAIAYLREKYTDQLFVGLEPMVKPAALATKTGVIAVCATPFTLQSARYLHLKEQYACDVTIIEPDCQEWAEMVERNDIDEESIQSTVSKVLAGGADVIVLACTHYHWIKERIINEAHGKASVIDPSDAISQRVKQLLSL